MQAMQNQQFVMARMGVQPMGMMGQVTPMVNPHQQMMMMQRQRQMQMRMQMN